MPKRIQLQRTRGWRMPEGAVKVDRSTRWGNPFEPGRRVIAPGAYGSLASPYHGYRPAGTYGTGPRAYEIRRVRDRADAVELFDSYVRHDPSGWPPEDIRYSLGGHHVRGALAADPAAVVAFDRGPPGGDAAHQRFAVLAKLGVEDAEDGRVHILAALARAVIARACLDRVRRPGSGRDIGGRRDARVEPHSSAAHADAP